MIGYAPQKLYIDGVSELWLRLPQPEADPPALSYKPAILIECGMNFRSLRAGLNHSEERSYTTWIPEHDLAIDWDAAAVELDQRPQMAVQADPSIPYAPGNYVTTASDFEQYEAELINRLVRTERIKIFFNPVFGLFSTPNDPLEEFLPSIAEAALGRVEPELRQLRNRFELQLEQIREAHPQRNSNDQNLSFESIISHKLHFFESENRLAAMFSTLAGAVFGTTEPRSHTEVYEPDEAELREDLFHVEQEASSALRALYSEYLTLANEYDIFEIGLQPDNVQVIRRALLWVPVEAGK
ncbi:MAG TPA: hypothetical protein VNH22_10930 [Blastocatellia bacterium]|jgi:hypothetical protein|nr:hypothetical protein [Blastocatellia bacterium]